jgi:hypothetical protein
VHEELRQRVVAANVEFAVCAELRANAVVVVSLGARRR